MAPEQTMSQCESNVPHQKHNTAAILSMIAFALSGLAGILLLLFGFTPGHVGGDGPYAGPIDRIQNHIAYSGMSILFGLFLLPFARPRLLPTPVMLIAIPIYLLGFAGIYGGLLPHSHPQQDRGREVIEQAIQANGGPAIVSKLRITRIKSEGMARIDPDKPAVPVITEEWLQLPSQWKQVIRYETGGRQTIRTTVLDGEAGWVQIDGKTEAPSKYVVHGLKDNLYAEEVGRLTFLTNEQYRGGTFEGELRDSQGRALLQVDVQAPNTWYISLYFDKQTSRLVKRTHRVFEYQPGTRSADEMEVVLGDYFQTQGVSYPRAFTIFKNGKLIAEMKVVEIQFFDKLEPEVFTKP